MEMTQEELDARKLKIDAFLAAYREVSLAHKLDFRAKLNVSVGGIFPQMEVFDVVEPKKDE